MLEEFIEELEKIKNQIIELYSPSKIILFGSLAKKCIKASSDIDLCVVIDTEDKRALIRDMYLKISTNKPYDILIYTISEFEKYKEDGLSFLYKILKEVVVIHGG